MSDNCIGNLGTFDDMIYQRDAKLLHVSWLPMIVINHWRLLLWLCCMPVHLRPL